MTVAKSRPEPSPYDRERRTHRHHGATIITVPVRDHGTVIGWKVVRR